MIIISNRYFEILDEIFSKIQISRENNVNYKKFLENPLSISRLREMLNFNK